MRTPALAIRVDRPTNRSRIFVHDSLATLQHLCLDADPIPMTSTTAPEITSYRTRRSGMAALLAVLVAATVLNLAPPAHAAGSDASRAVALVNAERKAAGL